MATNSTVPEVNADWSVITRRAACTAAARSFFAERDVVEIDVPCLQRGANLDHGVQLMQALTSATKHVANPPSSSASRYLATSPEHSLKRIVAMHQRDCYALCPAFRAGEEGRWHAPEFRMLEWYRLGMSLGTIAQEVCDLANRILGVQHAHHWLSYREAFRTYAKIDPFADGPAQWRQQLPAAAPDLPDDEILDYLLVTAVEPHLGRNGWQWLHAYPAEQAAQAQHYHDQDGYRVAARAELYWQGIELANAYHECSDADELRQRFMAEAAQRDPAPTIDEAYLKSVSALPDCCGVALGWERLLVCAFGLHSVAEVQALGWSCA